MEGWSRERFGRLEVDGKVQDHRPLDREFRRLGALQDLVDVPGRTPEQIDDIRPMTHQPSGFGELGKRADGRQT